MENIAEFHQRGGTETILLVEDSRESRKYAKYILQELGYAVIEANDGEDALRKFHEHKDRIQLVILDVIMPHGSIMPVYEAMHIARPDIKAIFMSGYTEDILKENRMLEEGLQFLTKPFQPAALADKVREVLDM